MDYQDLIEDLKAARRVVVLTGAGISAESGVPTFRGAGGLWKGLDPMQLATPEAFDRDPELVWEWYGWRRGLVAKCQPNPAHDFLAWLEPQVESFTLVTQNVDGLHQKAGSKNVIEIHGALFKSHCRRRCQAPREDFSVEFEELPRCPVCKDLERPGVVWFGESLPEGALEAGIEAAAQADVFLVIGTSRVVFPAASLVPLAARSGAKVHEINPHPGEPIPGMRTWATNSGSFLAEVRERWAD